MKHTYTDEQMQAAIDLAVAQYRLGTVCTLPTSWPDKWVGEMRDRLDLIKSALAALPEPMDEESMLLNLLAVIHRDGGHYQAEHGTRKAVEDACKEWQRLILLVEKAGLTEPKQSLSQLRPLAEAGDVPEGCVRYYFSKYGDDLGVGTKARHLTDVLFADICLPESDPLVAEHKALPEWKPQVGDVVTLKSGGPKMTVVKLADARSDLSAFLCEWFSAAGEYDSGVIYLTSLQPA